MTTIDLSSDTPSPEWAHQKQAYKLQIDEHDLEEEEEEEEEEEAEWDDDNSNKNSNEYSNLNSLSSSKGKKHSKEIVKDERSQFWANILSDDSDAERDRREDEVEIDEGQGYSGDEKEEEEEGEYRGYDNPYLDLDSNGENGAQFVSDHHKSNIMPAGKKEFNERISNDGLHVKGITREECSSAVSGHGNEEQEDCFEEISIADKRKEKCDLYTRNNQTVVTNYEEEYEYENVEEGQQESGDLTDQIDLNSIRIEETVEVDVTENAGEVSEDSYHHNECEDGFHSDRGYMQPTGTMIGSAHGRVVIIDKFEQKEKVGMVSDEVMQEITIMKEYGVFEEGNIHNDDEENWKCNGGNIPEEEEEALGNDRRDERKAEQLACRVEVPGIECNGDAVVEEESEHDEGDNSGEWEAQSYNYQGCDGQGELVFDLDSDSEEEEEGGEGDVSRTSSGTQVQATPNEGGDDDDGEEGEEEEGVEGDVSRTSSGTQVQAKANDGEKDDIKCNQSPIADNLRLVEGSQLQSQSSFCGAYSTPGRLRAPLIHVDTVHSTRGFCVDLDSDSDSDNDRNEDAVSDASREGDSDGEEKEHDDEGTLVGFPIQYQKGTAENYCTEFITDDHEAVVEVSPQRTPMSQPCVHTNTQRRSLLSTSSFVSTPSGTISDMMSPMSTSTVSSTFSSRSMSSHAVRSLALSRLNLVTVSNVKASSCHNSNRISPVISSPVARICYDKIDSGSCNQRWFEGSAFTPPPISTPMRSTSKCEITNHEPSDTEPMKSQKNNINSKTVFDDINDEEGKEDDEEEEEEEEMSEAGTLEAETFENEIISNREEVDENDDEDEDMKWIPKSSKKNTRTIVLDDSDSDSDYKADPDENSAIGINGREFFPGENRSLQGGKEKMNERQGKVLTFKTPTDDVMDLGLLDSDEDEELCEEDEEDIDDSFYSLEDNQNQENEEFEMNFDKKNVETSSPSKCKNKTFFKFRSIDIVCALSLDCGGNENSNPNLLPTKNTDVVTSFKGPVDHPISSVSDKMKRIYNKKISDAKIIEGLGNYEDSFKLYLEALEICDEDPTLHGKLAYISQELKYF